MKWRRPVGGSIGAGALASVVVFIATAPLILSVGIVVAHVIALAGIFAWTYTRHRPQPKHVEQANASLSFVFLVIASFAYEILFNFTPDRLRSLVAYSLAVAILVTAWSGERQWAVGSVSAAIGVFILAAGALLGVTTGAWSFSAADVLRRHLPLLAAVGMATGRRGRISGTALLRSAVAVVMFASIWSLVVGSAVIGNIARSAPFTGGSDGAHASALLLAICFLILNEGRLAGLASAKLLKIALTACLLNVLLLKVFTALVFIGAYASVRAISRSRRPGRLILVALGLLAATASLFVLRVRDQSSEIYRTRAVSAEDRLSSGRLATWEQRIGIYEEGSPAELFFGRGPGSDSFLSPDWRNEEKNSHNDFLTMLLEQGAVGLAALALVLIGLARASGGVAKAAVVALVAGGAVSNALLDRPLLQLLFWWAVFSMPVSNPTRARASSGNSAPSAPLVRRSDGRDPALGWAAHSEQ